MADSADDLLARAREKRQEFNQADEGTTAEQYAAASAIYAFSDLDTLLSSGGPLPTDWASRADENPPETEDVPLPDDRASVREAALSAYAKQNADVHRENMRLQDEIAELREQAAGAPAGGLPMRHGTEYHLRKALAGIAALREEISGARMMLSGLSVENARLNAEIDVHQGRDVLLCMDRDANAAMDVSRGERDGTILRTTDTGIEYELRGGNWVRRSSLGAGERA